MPFNELHKAIDKEFKKTFPGIPIYDEYPKGKALRKIPAIFFEFPEFEESENDPGTGEMQLRLTFEARVIISVKQKKARIEASNLSAKMALMLKNNNFGLSNVLIPERIRAIDEGLDPKVVGYESWLVQWEQEIRIGENVFDQEKEFIPDNVYMGYNPEQLEDYEKGVLT